jgi:hypothetical protein
MEGVWAGHGNTDVCCLEVIGMIPAFCGVFCHLTMPTVWASHGGYSVIPSYSSNEVGC